MFLLIGELFGHAGHGSHFKITSSNGVRWEGLIEAVLVAHRKDEVLDLDALEDIHPSHPAFEFKGQDTGHYGVVQVSPYFLVPQPKATSPVPPEGMPLVIPV